MRIYAYTCPIGPCPEYLNMTPMDNGSTILSVRTQGGNTASRINIPPQQMKEMGEWFLARAAELGV
jgi:hypothetical protein